MDPSRTLRLAIPKLTVEEVARQMHVSADYIRRWRRSMLSGDVPLGTGMRSPLDRILQLIDAVLVVNPTGPSLIVEHVNLHWEMLCKTHGIEPYASSAERAIAAADLLIQATGAVNTMNVEGVTEETLLAVIALRDAAAQAVNRIGKELYHKPQKPRSLTNVG